MIIEVTRDGWLSYEGRRIRCALGPAGVTSNKHEGDKATPLGTFPLRRALFRGDRLTQPVTALPIAPISENDGWCDDPKSSQYNQQVTLPHDASCESLWRADPLYDLIVVLGHNDDPIVAGNGSAIFLHVAQADFSPTEGCVAIALEELISLVEAADLETRLRIT